MKLKLVTLTIAFLGSVTCAAQSSSNELSKDLIRISIQPEGDQGTDALLDLVKAHMYIKLETSKESRIGRIDKLRFFNDRCFILDIHAGTIFIFDINGNYLSKIQSPDKGPGAYTNIMDFDIDEDGIIYALDVQESAIFKYDMEGTFIEKDKLRHFTKNLAVIDNSKLLTYHPLPIKEAPTGLLVMNSGRKRRSLIPYAGSLEPPRRVSFLRPFTLTHSQRILFSKDLSDTIYAVSGDGLQVQPKYFLDFGERTLTPEIKNNPDYFFSNHGVVKGGWRIGNFYENARYFTCSFNLEGRPWVLFYNKKEKNYLYSSCDGCDAVSPKVLGNLVVSAVYQDCFVSVISGESLSNAKSDMNPDQNHNFTLDSQPLIQDFNENDNPVLMVYKLEKED